jgi:hypothetical protein
VGALGVIGTLVYLSFQVRQNTRSIRARTYGAFVAQFRNWNEPMRVDKDMAENLHYLGKATGVLRRGLQFVGGPSAGDRGSGGGPREPDHDRVSSARDLIG